MKKVVLLALVTVLVLMLVGCSDGIDEYIKTYITDNIGYELGDLRVVKEDDSRFTIIATLKNNTSLEEFVPFTEKMISVSEEAANNKNVFINYVNTIIYLIDNDYYDYIGWSSRNGALYASNGGRVENIALENIDEEIENMFKRREDANKSVAAHLNFDKIKPAIQNYIIENTEFPISYVDIFEGNNWKLTINVGINGKEENDAIIERFEIFVEQVMNAISETAQENEAFIGLVLISISDKDDMAIVSWITENCEIGLLSININEDRLKYNDIPIHEIQSKLNMG